MKYGNIELLSGSKIYNLSIEGLSNDPTFDISDISRIYFNTTNNTYRYNNGNEYTDLSLPSNFMSLITTLGSNWINSDFTFNPTDFNSFNTISGLTSNNTLFDVLKSFDESIHNLDVPKLAELDDVVLPSGITQGQILYYSANNTFTFDTLDSLIENYSNIKVNSLHDVSSLLVDGGALVYDSEAEQYALKKTSVVIQDFYNTITHSIEHNLGVKYVSVSVVNASNDTSIPNASIQYIDVNSLSITLPTAAPIVVILSVPYGS